MLWVLGSAAQTRLAISDYLLALYFGATPWDSGWAGSLIGVWQRWDAVHYYRIATQGYSDPSLSAFFPLYPLLARGLHLAIGLDAWIGLAAVSNLAFLGALVLLYKICDERYGTQTATLAAGLFPTSFFLFTLYPQSLALMLTLLAYYLARHEKWVGAGLAGICAGLTHSTAAPLALLLGYLTWTNRPKRETWRSLTRYLAAICPMVGVGLFLAWRYTQGFPSLPDLMASNWGRYTVWPWQAIGQAIEALVSQPNAIRWLNFLLVLIGLATALYAVLRKEWDFAVYQASMLAFLLSTTLVNEPLCGLGRYSLLIFPLFIYLGRLIRGRLQTIGFLAASTSIDIFLCWFFFLWYFLG